MDFFDFVTELLADPSAASLTESILICEFGKIPHFPFLFVPIQYHASGSSPAKKLSAKLSLSQPHPRQATSRVGNTHTPDY